MVPMRGVFGAVIALAMAGAAGATTFTADTDDLTFKATNIDTSFDHIFFSDGFTVPASFTGYNGLAISTDGSAGIQFPALTDQGSATAQTVATKLSGANNNNFTFARFYVVDLTEGTRTAFAPGDLTTTSNGLEDDISIFFSPITSHRYGIEVAGSPTSGNMASVTKLTGNVTYSVTAVPEPASWLAMLAGFGLVGSALRSQRARRPLRS